MVRPNIFEIESSHELKKWYWLKQELVAYCQKINLSYVGQKFEILDRISNFLDDKIPQSQTISVKPISDFDWSKQTLTLNTLITDSYKNGKNVRVFFINQCGEKFHFSIAFMEFMTNNVGKTLHDAVNEWKRLHDLKKLKVKNDIPSGNQYNQYLRDFFEANPTLSMQQARACWAFKRSQPLGMHKFEMDDLKALEK